MSISHSSYNLVGAFYSNKVLDQAKVSHFIRSNDGNRKHISSDLEPLPFSRPNIHQTEE